MNFQMFWFQGGIASQMLTCLRNPLETRSSFQLCSGRCHVSWMQCDTGFFEDQRMQVHTKSEWCCPWKCSLTVDNEWHYQCSGWYNEWVVDECLLNSDSGYLLDISLCDHIPPNFFKASSAQDLFFLSSLHCAVWWADFPTSLFFGI